MRKIVVSVLALLNSVGYASSASMNGKNINSEAIYCPESVTCTRGGDVSSCTYKTDHPEYWQRISANFNRNVTAGTHRLYRVLAYRRSRLFRSSFCSYQTTDAAPENVGNMFLAVYSYKLANLEILDNPTWAASIIDKADGFGDCFTSDSKQCPLSSHSTLIIHNLNMLDGVTVSVNGSRVSLDKPIDEGQDGKIFYDDVLAGCGAADVCRIDITSQQGGIYGYVFVDMTHHMKILSINSNRPSEVMLKQIDGFNAIEIAYGY